MNMSPNTMNCCAMPRTSPTSASHRHEAQRILPLAACHDVTATQQFAKVEQYHARQHQRRRSNSESNSFSQRAGSTPSPPSAIPIRTQTPTVTPFLMPADFYKSLLVSAAALQQQHQEQQKQQQQKLFEDEVEYQRIEKDRKTSTTHLRYPFEKFPHAHNAPLFPRNLLYSAAAAAAAAAQRHSPTAELASDTICDSNGSDGDSNHVS